MQAHDLAREDEVLHRQGLRGGEDHVAHLWRQHIELDQLAHVPGRRHRRLLQVYRLARHASRAARAAHAVDHPGPGFRSCSTDWPPLPPLRDRDGQCEPATTGTGPNAQARAGSLGLAVSGVAGRADAVTACERKRGRSSAVRYLRSGVKRLQHKLDGMLSELGMHPHRLLDHSIYLHKGMPIGATAHQAGTVRFGTDPRSSALDVNCRAHDVDNLYVVDTSFFPSIGAVNPSLTAIANALRVGDQLIERLG